ncbi:hypothetical protein [Serratia sp. D1N4]
MTFLKILVTTLGQVLNWCASNRAQQFVETQFRLAGYDEDDIATAREAVSLLTAAFITALMNLTLQILSHF